MTNTLSWLTIFASVILAVLSIVCLAVTGAVLISVVGFVTALTTFGSALLRLSE